MKKLYLHVAVAALMVLPAGSALAAQTMNNMVGIYGGFGFGRAESEDFCENVSGNTFGACDDSDNAWKLFAGYQFTPNWGLEAGYVDLGETIFTSGLNKTTQESSALSLAVVGTAEYTDQFDVFAKVGAFRWDMDTRATLADQAENDDGTSLLLGIGAKYHFTDYFGMQAEWEWYQDIGEREKIGGKSDINMLSIGLFANF